ncbi:Shedu immune nuclease family protein [Amycolatopsis sp. NPDC088138]|uniref:Shedu immune nuclease family protein n=1 Tax=Amycolatopsis sp. NPDC088138 TaxID=3363938 RepID=UPI00381415C4
MLEETRQLTTSAEVQRHIDAALEFTNSGPDTGGHRYPRGKPLVTYLRDAAEAAAHLGQTTLNERLTDFAEYASGHTPLTLLESRYTPGAKAVDDRFLQAILGVGFRRCVEVLEEFGKDRPTASAREVTDWLRTLAETMERWEAGEERLGGVKLSWQRLDHLRVLERVQLVLKDPSSGTLPVPPDIAQDIAEMPGVELIAQAVQWQRRKLGLKRLREVVEDPLSTERDIHQELKRQTWIFGGRYAQEIARRRLTTVDELDIPLLRGDGALHVVELKKAVVPHLVELPRSHWTVGPDVHRAVTQAANYLRTLDENRAGILADHGIECRRASATVLIGHPKFLDRPCAPTDLSAALRTYNAALSRIEVITYEELIDSAERMLSWEDDEQ